MSQSERVENEGRKRFLTGRDLDYIEKVSVGHPNPYVSDNKRAESSYRSQLKAKIKNDLVPYYLEHLDDWNTIAQALTFDEDMGQLNPHSDKTEDRDTPALNRDLKPFLKKEIEKSIPDLSDFLKNWLSDEGFQTLLCLTLSERRKVHSGQRYFSPAAVLTVLAAYVDLMRLGELDPALEAKRQEAARLLREISDSIAKIEVKVEGNPISFNQADQLFPVQNVIGHETAWLLAPKGLTTKREESTLIITPGSGEKVSFSWGYGINIPALVLEALTVLSPKSEGGYVISPRKGASISGILMYLAQEVADLPIVLLDGPGPAQPKPEIMGSLRDHSGAFSIMDPDTLKKIIKGGDALAPFDVDTDQWYMATWQLRDKVYDDIWTLKLSMDTEEVLKSYPFITLDGRAATVLAILYPFNTMDWLKRSLVNETGGVVTCIKNALKEMEERGLIVVDSKRWWWGKEAIHITEKGLNISSHVVKRGHIAINRYWDRKRVPIS